MFYGVDIDTGTKEMRARREEVLEWLDETPAGRRPDWATPEGTEMTMEDIAASGIVRRA